MYDQAYSSIHINGHTTGPIPIQCGVQQDCPLSMLLFALSLNPLLWLLDQTLTGIRTGRETRTVVVAYADDNPVYDRSEGHSCVSRYTTELPRGNRSMPKHTKIESNGGRFMGCNSKHDGYPVLHGNDHPGVPIFELRWTIREEQLDEGDGTG